VCFTGRIYLREFRAELHDKAVYVSPFNAILQAYPYRHPSIFGSLGLRHSGCFEAQLKPSQTLNLKLKS
jgi:hypothetical protein